jgi:dihydrofolate synthase/folylpolyglutamate synthase
LDHFLNYKTALEFVLGLGDNSLKVNLTPEAAKFDLQVMRDLLAPLGNPQDSYPVIHVAGTKGKGSTCAMIARVLQAAGFKVGLFTSPYLSDFREQIQVNGEMISQDEFVSLTKRLAPIINRLGTISTFEATTSMAFQYFKNKRVDFAVIEVGLGGRLDATNVVDPLLSVITSISYDHLAFLGNTMEAIASEKAGIIKPGKPVILAPQTFSEATRVVKEIAYNKHSEIVEVSVDHQWKILSHDLSGQKFRVESKNPLVSSDKVFKLRLLGDHQVENAVTVLSIIRFLRKKGVLIKEDAVVQGLKSSYIHCRFDVVRKQPLIVLDAAHNEDSARRLRKTITDYLPGRKITLIFGVSMDKEIAKILAELLPISNRVIFTNSGHPRAANPLMLVELAQQYRIPSMIQAEVSNALQTAIDKSDPQGAIIVTGSIFTAARARETILHQRKQEV